MSIPKYKFIKLKLESFNNTNSHISTISVTEKYIAVGFNNSQIKLFNFNGDLAFGSILKFHKDSRRSQNSSEILNINIDKSESYLVAISESSAAVFDFASESEYDESSNEMYIFPSITAAIHGLKCCCFTPSFNNKKSLPNILVASNKLILLSKRDGKSLFNANKLENKILDHLTENSNNSNETSQNQIYAIKFSHNNKYLAYATRFGIKIAKYNCEEDELDFLGFQQKPGGHQDLSSSTSNYSIFCKITWINNHMFCVWGDHILYGKIEITKQKIKNNNLAGSLPRDIGAAQFAPRAPVTHGQSSLNYSIKYKTKFVPVQSFKLDDCLFRGLVIQKIYKNNFSPRKQAVPCLPHLGDLDELNTSNNFENSFQCNHANLDRDFDRNSISSFNTILTEATNYTSTSRLTATASNSKLKTKIKKNPQPKLTKIKLTALTHSSKFTDQYKFGVENSGNLENNYELRYYDIDINHLFSSKLSDYENSIDQINQHIDIDDIESDQNNQNLDTNVTLYQSIENNAFICDRKNILTLVPLTVTNQVQFLLEEGKVEDAYKLAISVPTFQNSTATAESITVEYFKSAKNSENDLNLTKLDFENSKKVDLDIQDKACIEYLRFLIDQISELLDENEHDNDIDRSHSKSNVYLYPGIIAFIKNKSAIWQEIFKKFKNFNKLHCLIEYLPIRSDDIIFDALGGTHDGEELNLGPHDLSSMTKSLTLNNDPCRLTKNNYAEIAIASIKDTKFCGIKKFQKLIEPNKQLWLKTLKPHLSQVIFSIHDIEEYENDLFLAELYLLIDQPTSAFIIYIKNKSEKVFEEEILDHPKFVTQKCDNVMNNLKDLILVDVDRTVELLVSEIDIFSPESVYSKTEVLLGQPTSTNTPYSEEEMTTLFCFTQTNENNIYTNFITKYFQNLKDPSILSHQVLIDKTEILAKFSPEDLFDFLRTINKRLLDDADFLNNVCELIKSLANLAISESRLKEVGRDIDAHIQGAKQDQEVADRSPHQHKKVNIFTKESVWLLGLQGKRTEALNLLIKDDNMINEALIFCKEWHLNDKSNISTNLYLEKLVDLAKSYNKESILLPALVKQNGFDYYTLSLLKSLPDDFMLSSNHISVIIEQCNYQENMINYSRDVQNNEALKSIFELYDSQSGVV